MRIYFSPKEVLTTQQALLVYRDSFLMQRNFSAESVQRQILQAYQSKAKASILLS